MNKLLSVLIGLMVWGPPRLRLNSRPLDIALKNPLDLDFAALFQAGVWIGGGILVTTLLVRQVIRRNSLLPLTLKGLSLKWYFIFGLIAVSSTFYSSSPVYTLFFAGKIIIAILSVAFLFQEAQGRFPEKKAVNILYTVFILQGIAIAVFYFTVPDLVGVISPAFGYRLHGGILADYGSSMLFTGLFFLTISLFNSNREKRYMAFLVYLISLFFLLMAKTRSTNFVAMLFPIILVISHKSLNVRMRCAFAISLLIITIFWMGYVGPALGFITRDFEGFSTLTGRTVAFSYLLEYWKESPLWGFGYAAGTRFNLMPFVWYRGLGIGTAHDAVSKVLVDLGLLGAVPLMLTFIFVWKELIILWRKTKESPELYILVLQLICLMTAVTLQNITSEGIAGLSMPFIIVICTTHFINQRYYEKSY